MRHHDDYNVNPFKPKDGTMVDELAVIVAILVGWGTLNFGFQLLLGFLAETPDGNGMLTILTLLSFPWHFWFTAQFLPLWFIVLCVLFNLYMDRVTERHNKIRDRIYE